MLKTGLVSVSFRSLSVAEIIYMVKKAGLDAIEWGGDMHVPHGDAAIAENTYNDCFKAGIECPSYGSYYKLGEYSDSSGEFTKVLDSAIRLKSDIIRIWAGTRSSEEADDLYWNQITNELIQICELAGEKGTGIALEYHANTLTDNSSDTLKLLEKVNKKNLTTYWQPPVSLNIDENIRDLVLLGDNISNIHTFAWLGRERMPLSEGFIEWKKYLGHVNTTKKRYCLLEFIKDDSVEGFYRDAKTLKRLTEKYR